MKNYREALLLLIKSINALEYKGEKSKGRISFLEGVYIKTTLGTTSKTIRVKISYEDVKIMPIIDTEFIIRDDNMDDIYKRVYIEFLQYTIFSQKFVYEDLSGNKVNFSPLKELLTNGYS